MPFHPRIGGVLMLPAAALEADAESGDRAHAPTHQAEAIREGAGHRVHRLAAPGAIPLSLERL